MWTNCPGYLWINQWCSQRYTWTVCWGIWIRTLTFQCKSNPLHLQIPGIQDEKNLSFSRLLNDSHKRWILVSFREFNVTVLWPDVTLSSGYFGLTFILYDVDAKERRCIRLSYQRFRRLWISGEKCHKQVCGWLLLEELECREGDGTAPYRVGKDRSRVEWMTILQGPEELCIEVRPLTVHFTSTHRSNRTSLNLNVHFTHLKITPRLLLGSKNVSIKRYLRCRTTGVFFYLKQEENLRLYLTCKKKCVNVCMLRQRQLYHCGLNELTADFMPVRSTQCGENCVVKSLTVTIM